MTTSDAAKSKPIESPRAARLVTFPLIILVALISPPHHARAQTSAPAPDEVIRVDTNLVVVPVVVTDGRGRRAHGLTKDDFDVLEEGRNVVPSYFAAGTDRVALLFLLDASGSVREHLARQREAALALFSRFGKSSRVAVAHFQEKISPPTPFTADPDRAREAFTFVALPDRRTAIFDAALTAARAFKEAKSDQGERRIVVLISDGLDTASVTRPLDAVNEAALADVTFYVIHTPLFIPRDGRLVARAPSKGFRELAEKTGGQFFVVGDVAAALSPHPQYDFEPIFRAIEDDLRGQYVVGYYAGDAERRGRLRAVEVRLKPQAGRKLRVRQLRKGYSLGGAAAGDSAPAAKIRRWQNTSGQSDASQTHVITANRSWPTL